MTSKSPLPPAAEVGLPDEVLAALHCIFDDRMLVDMMGASGQQRAAITIQNWLKVVDAARNSAR
jgi:hypothetical protein